jgi:hypothetical protein
MIDASANEQLKELRTVIDELTTELTISRKIQEQYKLKLNTLETQASKQVVLLKEGEFDRALTEQFDKVHQQSDYAQQQAKTLAFKNEQLLVLKASSEEQLKKLKAEVAELSQKLKEQTLRYSADTERLANANTMLKGELIEKQRIYFDAERAKRETETN